MVIVYQEVLVHDVEYTSDKKQVQVTSGGIDYKAPKTSSIGSSTALGHATAG